MLTALRWLWAFRRRGWWRRPPFLPLPPREYLAWRMGTFYGSSWTVRQVWSDRANVLRYLKNWERDRRFQGEF